jgi:hypothetical protein
LLQFLCHNSLICNVDLVSQRLSCLQKIKAILFCRKFRKQNFEGTLTRNANFEVFV